MEEEEGGKISESNWLMRMPEPKSEPESESEPKSSKMVVWLSTLAISLVVVYIVSYNNSFTQVLGIYSSSSSNNITRYSMEDYVIHDEHYELRKALKAASTDEQTVILTTLNKAWAEPGNIFDLFLDSFKHGNNTTRLLNHLLVIAVDEKAYSRCQALVRHCYLFKGGNHSTRELANEALYMSPIYLDMMWERLAFLHTILTLGYNFVFTDTDVMWFRDPFPHFYPNVDFQTSCDVFNGSPFDLDNYPNNGFNFVRSNNRTIEFYKYWVSSRQAFPTMHEQNVFNFIKNDTYTRELGIRFMFLDTDYFGGFCSPSEDFNKVCTMHANCCVGLERKIADLKTIIQDWKRYVSSTKKTTTFHWRAPHSCPVIRFNQTTPY